MEIHNLYSLDIFLQGFFLSICVFLGLFIIFRNNLEKYNEPQSVNNLSNYLRIIILTGIRVLTLKDIPEFEKEGANDKEQPNNSNKKKSKKGSKNQAQYNILLLIPIAITISFIIGIMGNSLADEWIDSNNRNHLYLKSLWGGEIAGKISLNLKNKFIDKDDVLKINTNSEKFIYKPLIKLQSFKRVFKGTDVIKHEDDIDQLYYHSKHEIIANNQFSRYIRKNQIISEYSRVFALGFYFLTICGLINLIIMIIRVLYDKEINDIKELKDNEEELKSNTVKKSTKNKDTKITKAVIIIFTIVAALLITFFTGVSWYNIFHYDFYIFPLIIILIYFGCVTFLMSLFNKFKTIRFSFFIYSLLYVASIIGYFSSAKIWFSSEKQVSLKVYGILKTTHLTKEIEEIKFAENDLKLKIINIEIGNENKKRFSELKINNYE